MSEGDADTGAAPGRVPATVRELSRQNAFKVRTDEALVEKAREAYDATGGGVAGMQVRLTEYPEGLLGSGPGACTTSVSGSGAEVAVHSWWKQRIIDLGSNCHQPPTRVRCKC